ncbi:hypothetical protein DFH06DRAFT_1131746 [Mycena polygramma]|nr:hypothetical protein DFH06DRAFT_1131746 [Mycena polygramma]
MSHGEMTVSSALLPRSCIHLRVPTAGKPRMSLAKEEGKRKMAVFRGGRQTGPNIGIAIRRSGRRARRPTRRRDEAGYRRTPPSTAGGQSRSPIAAAAKSARHYDLTGQVISIGCMTTTRGAWMQGVGFIIKKRKKAQNERRGQTDGDGVELMVVKDKRALLTVPGPGSRERVARSLTMTNRRLPEGIELKSRIFCEACNELTIKPTNEGEDGIQQLKSGSSPRRNKLYLSQPLVQRVVHENVEQIHYGIHVNLSHWRRASCALRIACYESSTRSSSAIKLAEKSYPVAPAWSNGRNRRKSQIALFQKKKETKRTSTRAPGGRANESQRIFWGWTLAYSQSAFGIQSVDRQRNGGATEEIKKER